MTEGTRPRKPIVRGTPDPKPQCQSQPKQSGTGAIAAGAPIILSASVEMGEQNPNKPCSPTGGILSLPEEVLTMIIHDLHPGEALFLSLTCRAFYHGVLSPYNTFLWYQVGRFAHGLPGWSKSWRRLINITLPPPPPGEAIIFTPPNQPHKERAKKRGGKLTAAKKEAKSLLSPQLTARKAKELIMNYNPQRGELEPVIDYKRMLVETMIGLTYSGCGWCLNEPGVRRHFYEWNIRLCTTCFVRNAIPIEALDSLKPRLDLNTASLPIEWCPYDLNFFGPPREFTALWRPHVLRLLSAHPAYGPQTNLPRLLERKYQVPWNSVVVPTPAPFRRKEFFYPSPRTVPGPTKRYIFTFAEGEQDIFLVPQSKQAEFQRSCADHNCVECTRIRTGVVYEERMRRSQRK